MLLTRRSLLAAGVPRGLLRRALSFMATLHLVHPDCHDPDADVILREILDDPVGVMIDGSLFNHNPILDETIARFAERVALHREDV